MGLFSKVVKAGMAKKVLDEARKPENQRRMKELLESAKAQVGKRRGGTRGSTPGSQGGRPAG